MGNFNSSKAFEIKIGRKSLRFPENYDNCQKINIFLKKLKDETFPIEQKIKEIQKVEYKNDSLNKSESIDGNQDKKREEIEQYINSLKMDDMYNFIEQFNKENQKICDSRNDLINAIKE